MDSFDFATDLSSSIGNRIVLMTDNVEDKKSLTPGNHFLFNLHRQKKGKYMYLRRLGGQHIKNQNYFTFLDIF